MNWNRWTVKERNCEIAEWLPLSLPYLKIRVWSGFLLGKPCRLINHAYKCLRIPLGIKSSTMPPPNSCNWQSPVFPIRNKDYSNTFNNPNSVYTASRANTIRMTLFVTILFLSATQPIPILHSPQILPFANPSPQGNSIAADGNGKGFSSKVPYYWINRKGNSISSSSSSLACSIKWKGCRLLLKSRFLQQLRSSRAINRNYRS